MTLHPTVFNLLEKPIREALAELGFSEPTLPQIKAIPHILEGENVLLIAPTGSGKTEAVLLPVFFNFIQQPNKRGISIVYVTPLRALNRDMVKRLAFWAERLDISIEVRHGDQDSATPSSSSAKHVSYYPRDSSGNSTRDSHAETSQTCSICNY